MTLVKVTQEARQRFRQDIELMYEVMSEDPRKRGLLVTRFTGAEGPGWAMFLHDSIPHGRVKLVIKPYGWDVHNLWTGTGARGGPAKQSRRTTEEFLLSRSNTTSKAVSL